MEEARLSILENLDQLEELFFDGNRIPFSGNRLVNENDAIELLDEIRETLPSQINAANEIINQGDSYVKIAKQKAEDLIAKAKNTRDKLIDSVGVRQEAERQIHQMQAQSRTKCETLIKEARQKVSNIEHELQLKITKLEQTYSLRRHKLEEEAMQYKKRIELENIELTKDLKKRFDNNNSKAIEQLDQYRREGILIQQESQKEAERISQESLRLRQQTQQKCDSMILSSRNEAAFIQDGANRYAE